MYWRLKEVVCRVGSKKEEPKRRNQSSKTRN